MYDEIRKTVQVEDTEKSIEEHEALLRSLRAGDEAEALDLLREHIRSVARKLKNSG